MHTRFFGCLALAASVGLAVVSCGTSSDGDGSAFGDGHAGSSGEPDTGGSDGGGAADGFVIDGGAGTDEDADAESCGSVLLGAQAQPGNVVVVFDQSDSMGQSFSAPDAGATGPKWKVARDALATAVQPVSGSLRAGAIFFPTAPKQAGSGTCGGKVDPITSAPPQIGIQDGAAFLTAWSAHFGDPAWKLVLSTPLKIALDEANAALADPFPFPGPRVVVVMTDGAPTCITDPAQILAPVEDMATRGVTTYVVGLPGSSKAATLLNALAVAGGTGQYLTPADPQSLADALAGIAKGAVDVCTMALSPAPPDPSKVYLYVTDQATGMQREVPMSDGWSLAPDGATATLTGMLCDQAKAGAFSAIQFVFGCPLHGPH
jgi:hypothetical protein